MTTHNPYANAYRGARPWSKEEDAKLVDMLQKRMRYHAIAKALRRTEGSVQMRILVVDPDRKNRPAKNVWTEEQTQIAQRLLDENAPKEKFLRLTGHTRYQAQLKLLRMRANARMESGEPPPSAIVIPPDVLADRYKRQIAHYRDQVGALMGDPPVGFSALEQRR